MTAETPCPSPWIAVDMPAALHMYDADLLDIRVTLLYRQRDPLAVEITFHAMNGAVPWSVARELLAAGLEAPTGDGDVTIRPAGSDSSVLRIMLSSPDGTGVVDLERAAVAAFLKTTHSIVAPGDEVVDVDSAIEAIYAWIAEDQS